ncbi:class I SAM-dependent methyltransferase [Candidatus Peregrinibacteria bacterium]|nr:class I SAM-dependent methyltransferase [Candidatus Peregrinibacteria bacterium]
MKESTAKQLLKKVEQDYDLIADEFSETRKWLWPEFEGFKKYLKDGQTILDLGCGNGRLYPLLKDLKNLKYVGIDNNKKFVQLAKEKFKSAKFLYGNALSIPYSSKVDILFIIASFHHIPSNKLRIKCIQEIKRLLTPNSVLIITVWNLFQPKYFSYILKSLFKYFIQLGKYNWNDTFIPWGNKKVLRYYHAFNKRELKNLFVKNGFKILEFTSNHNHCLVCKIK